MALLDEYFMTSSSKVRFVSSIIAVSEPFMGKPAASKIFGSTTCPSVFMRSMPSDSARRRAGSMVRQSTRRPARAAATARAAALVVFPTPPAPTVMSTRRFCVREARLSGICGNAD